MPRLLSRSKHEEFESNSTLQIRVRRKEGAEAEKEEKQRKKRSREFRTTVRKFRTGANFLLAPLFMLPLTF